MVWAAETELYAGDGVRACEILERDRRALKPKLPDARPVSARATAFVRARALVASPAARRERGRGAHPGGAASCARARSGANALDCGALVTRHGHRARTPRGPAAAAIAALEIAIHRADVADMALFAWAARHRLGLLVGGADGARRVREAEEAIRAQGIVVPARFAGMLLAGPLGCRRRASPQARAKRESTLAGLSAVSRRASGSTSAARARGPRHRAQTSRARRGAGSRV